MKKLLLLSFSLCCFIMASFQQPISAQQTPSADKILADARSVATKENKNVFVIFHASWCGWCHKMDTAMNDPAIKKFFSDNYVVRHLVVMESKNKKNLENPGALELMQKYSGEGSGIPFWFISDKNGQFLMDSRQQNADGKPGDNVGCPASDKEVEYFIKVLKQTSKIDEPGLAAIKTRFRKTETK